MDMLRSIWFLATYNAVSIIFSCMLLIGIVSLFIKNKKYDFDIYKKIFAIIIALIMFISQIIIFSIFEKASVKNIENLEYLYKNSDDYTKNKCKKYILRDLSQKNIIHFSVLLYERCFNEIKNERDVEIENLAIKEKNKQFSEILEEK